MNRVKRVEHIGSTTYVRLPLMVFIGIVLALIALTIVLWSAKRKQDAVLRVNSPSEVRLLLPSLVGLTQSNADGGNRVEVLQNGDGFFPTMMRDVAAARESVHVETYIWAKSRIGTQFAQLLAQKAKQGVEVRVLVDASGGRDLKGDLQKMLEQAGAKVAHFHPVRISNLGRLNNRDHRKLVIIDGRIGYTGGHGVSDNWTGHAQDKKHWRDTALRMTGPVVNRLQSCFSENWIEETGEIPAGEKYFPHLQPAGPTVAHVAYTSPSGSVSSVQILYYLAIKSAKREILIQNPYLLPERQAIEALAEAVKRGVDVRIMVPSTDATDSAIVQHASHHHFGSLLKRGVKLYEYKHTLLHQKIIVVDGIWSSVGSTNWDERSFQLNDEVNVGVLDAAVAAQLRNAFINDLRHASQPQFQQWQDRSLWHKFVDGLAYLGHAQL
ncbi:MAG TPA: cardiolipin synthase [Thermoanaerobaculia bacterium]|nr:cardiolipin synthase [Thermoanaerobaculia bacterium]